MEGLGRMEDTEVLVVGAGPVGLTLAVDLGQRGIKTTLIDQKPGPEFLPKMERCNARTMEIFRRLGLANDIRRAGLAEDVPMDVYIAPSMAEAPYVHLKYPSVEAARDEISATDDTSQPAEPYQLISQYTLEPLLRKAAEALPTVTVRYNTEFISLRQDAASVVAEVHEDGVSRAIRSDYLVGCDGGSSPVRHALQISLRGEANILRLRQALYRSDDLYGMLPIGDGPGRGRHYHIADDQHSFLIMQDSTQHWTLHAVVDSDAAMAQQFEKVVGTPVDYEMLYVGEWKQNLLLADSYGAGRVFLAGDAIHLVIPTGGLGMNTGVGDAIDLSWKLAATIKGWGGPKLLRSYEIERRPVGDRNIGASRYASSGRRKWRGLWSPNLSGDTAARSQFASVAAEEQRKTNEMIGAELGYRYGGSPIIHDELGGAEHSFRRYDPTAWTGVRLPHAWVEPGVSTQDVAGPWFTVLSFCEGHEEALRLAEALRVKGAPVKTVHFDDSRLRDLYGRDVFLLRPDLHIAWRGNRLTGFPAQLVDEVSGWG